MRDTTVQTLFNMATLLAQKTDDLELCQDHRNDLADQAHDLKNEVDDLQLQLRNAQLASVRNEREQSDSRLHSVLVVHRALFESPTSAHELRTYLHSHDGRKDLVLNKIVVIKRVRDLTGCGLKECKDFVEDFKVFDDMQPSGG